jgi:hypothetical protein
LILALIIFLVFLVVVITSICWLIKLDTNKPDTEFSLVIAPALVRVNKQIKQNLIPAFNQMTISMKEAQKSFARVAEILKEAQKKHAL